MENDEDLGIIPGEDEFSEAADRIAHAVVAGPRPSEADLLRFYGLYKQATAGDSTEPMPPFWRIGHVQKWHAWRKLRGMTQQQAMQEYARLADSRLGAAQDPLEGGGRSQAAQGGGLGGPVVSRMAPLGADAARAAPGGAAGAPVAGDLHELAGGGDAAAVAALVDGGACGVDDADESGCTALHFAADRGRLEVLALLLARGADVNARDSDGQTPLHYAAVCRQKEAYAALLEAGADPTIADNDGQTPAEAADWET